MMHVACLYLALVVVGEFVRNYGGERTLLFVRLVTSMVTSLNGQRSKASSVASIVIRVSVCSLIIIIGFIPLPIISRPKSVDRSARDRDARDRRRGDVGSRERRAESPETEHGPDRNPGVRRAEFFGFAVFPDAADLVLRLLVQ